VLNILLYLIFFELKKIEKKVENNMDKDENLVPYIDKLILGWYH
jgi:hypothetical protein